VRPDGEPTDNVVFSTEQETIVASRQSFRQRITRRAPKGSDPSVIAVSGAPWGPSCWVISDETGDSRGST
jgi:hypothetical protein